MKISFIGLPGSGKTTLANKLSKELGIQTINIDQLFDDHPLFFFSKKRYRQAYRDYLRGKNEWIIDGYHGSKQPQTVWTESDAIIVMSIPRKELFGRVFSRYRHKKQAGEKTHWQHTFIKVLRNWAMISSKQPLINAHIRRLSNDERTKDKIIVIHNPQQTAGKLIEKIRPLTKDRPPA